MPSQQKRVRRASVSDAVSERARLMKPLSSMAHLNVSMARHPSPKAKSQNQTAHPDLDYNSSDPYKAEPEFEAPQMATSYPPQSEIRNELDPIVAERSQETNLPKADPKERHYLWGACGVMIGTSIGAIPSVGRFIATNLLSYEGFLQVIMFFSSLTLGIFLWMTLSRR